jgi:uncharacterized radical SAM superfamily Fe-S cluster-containing enzyme
VARVGAYLYFQLDGFKESTHRAIRGKDLRADKQRALDRCAELGITVVLVAAVERGINEQELGAIVRFGVEHPAVKGVVFQPVTHAGRHVEFDPLERLTNADVMHLLAAQLPDWLAVSDFVPVPCCFPTCRSMCYGLVDDGAFMPVARLFDVEEYLDYAANRVFPDLEVRHALEKMFSASATPGAEQALLACASCGIDLPEALRAVEAHGFMIVAQDFQDPYTLNVRQLMKCCVEQITPDGRLIPFCAYNSVGYREQVRAQMSGVEVPALVPNASALQPLLEVTRYGSRTVKRNGDAPAARADARNTGRRLGG